MKQPAASRKRVIFDGNTPFYKELRRRVAVYFTDANLDRGANASMWLKTAILFAVVGVSYSLFLTVADAWWQLAALGSVAGFFLATIGFCVQHDGGHKAYSHKHPWINRTMAFALDILGGSSYMWHWKHNIFHHTYPNIDGLDDDIALLPLARLAPSQRRLPIHRLQWIYIWVLYGLLAIKWHFIDDFRGLLLSRLGGHSFPRPKGLELFLFFAGKLLWVTWMLVIPITVVGWQSWLIFFIPAEITTGLVLALVFQLAHCVEGVEWAELPAEGQTMREDWASFQMRTATDFARSNRLVTWFVGGLNFQVVHHLFPRVCHVHYPALSKIIEEVAAEYGVPYNVHESFFGIIGSHTRWLRQMGMPVSEPVGASLATSS